MVRQIPSLWVHLGIAEHHIRHDVVKLVASTGRSRIEVSYELNLRILGGTRLGLVDVIEHGYGARTDALEIGCGMASRAIVGGGSKVTV